MRPLNCLMAGLAVLIGVFVAGWGPLFPIFLAVAATILITGGGMGVNDYFDHMEDRVHKSHRPIPSGRITRWAALVFSSTLIAIGIYLTAFINPYTLTIAVVNSFLLIFYAFHLQKKFFFSNLTVSFLVGSTFVFGGFVVGFSIAPLALGFMAFFSNLSREIVKDLEDKYEDMRKGVKSLPILLGENRSRVVSSLMLLPAFFIAPIPVIYGIFSYAYLAVVSLSILVFVYTIYLNFKKEKAENLHKLMKIGMLIGLLAFLAGSL